MYELKQNKCSCHPETCGYCFKIKNNRGEWKFIRTIDPKAELRKELAELEAKADKIRKELEE